MPPQPETTVSDLPTVSGTLRPALDGRSATGADRRRLLRDYFALTKPEISFLVGISTLCGLLAAPETPSLATALAAVVGSLLCAGGACALNHAAEGAVDRKMRRTADRPVAAGRLSVANARAFGAIMVAAGLGLLCPLTNAATAVLAAVTVVLYLYVYTPLKRHTAWNTLVGAIPGALPALGGAVAVSGSPGPGGWLVFGLLFSWQIPHFMALAWMYRKDYDRGGFRMVTNGDATGRRTGGWALLGAVLAAACGAAVAPAGAGGPVLLFVAVVGGVYLIHASVRFLRSPDAGTARRLLKASVYYIPAFALGLVADWLIFGGPTGP